MVRVPRPPRVAAELTKGPFSLQEARLHGVTKDQLRGLSWRRVDRGVYAWHAIADRRMVRLRAAMQRLPQGAAFSGSTAGWLHGLDLEPCDPIEAIVPTACMVTRRSGIRLRRSACLERSIAHGLPVTTRVRTVADLVCRQTLVEAVTILDMALHRRVVTAPSLHRCTAMPATAVSVVSATRSNWPSQPLKAQLKQDCDCCSSCRVCPNLAFSQRSELPRECSSLDPTFSTRPTVW